MVAQIKTVVVPVVSPADQIQAIATILNRTIDGDAINMDWQRNGSTIYLFEEGWTDELKLDEDTEVPENRAVYFAAFAWLVKVANRWEEMVGDGEIEMDSYDVAWNRDLIKDTFQYFGGAWNFPRAQSDRVDGFESRYIEWTVDDAEFQAIAGLIDA